MTESLAQAIERHRAGDWAAAEHGYRTMLAAAPACADAWHLLGVLLCQTGRHDAGITALEQALGLVPGMTDAAYHCALAHQECGRHHQALPWLARVLAAQPDHDGALYRVGLAHLALGRAARAADWFARALGRRPDQARLHDGLGTALLALGDAPGAVAAHRRAVALDGGSAEAWTNLGNGLRVLGDDDAAAAAHGQAIRRRPDFAAAHANLGALEHGRGRWPAALAALDRAVTLGHADGGQSLGALVYSALAVCDWDRVAQWEPVLLAQVRAGAGAEVQPLVLMHLESATAGDQAIAAAGVASAAGNQRFPRTAAAPCVPGDRLRLGYLSADFHQHPTAALTAELFELHDRARVTVSGYSYGPDDGSAMRRRLVAGFDRFIDLSRTDDRSAAARIAADGIQVLIDLKGYTTNARPGIVAARAAPVQVHYLGYPGTLGGGPIDYGVVDPVVVPLDHSRHFAEALIWLPECYQVNDRRRQIQAPVGGRTAHGLPEQAFVFCCFNNPAKITRPVFRVWLGVLGEVPGAVLWLLDGGAVAGEHLRREAAAAGIDPGRLYFAARRPAEAYRGLYRLADLFLDTAPYNAHTTGSDALWAGLPMVTRLGDTMAGRVGASLVTAVGLGDLVAADWAGYRALAVALARTPARLDEVRSRLAAARGTAPLFDSPRFTRHFEDACWLVWRRHMAGLAPASIHVPARREGQPP